MPKEFSQTNPAGRAYLDKKEKRRTPSRKNQKARGRQFDFAGHAARQAESARKAMKRGRTSAPGD